MKNKHLLCMLTLLMVVMIAFAFVSCGDDEDEVGGGNGPNSAGVLDKENNKRVKTVGNYNFYYNDQGQIDYITEGNTRYTFNYNPNTIVQSYRGKEEAVYSVSYNGLGNITRIEVKEMFEEGGIVEISGSSTLNYDGSGHLVSIEGTSIETYKGETSRSSGSAELRWKNNQLISAVWESTEEDEYGKSTYTETYDYTYGSNINDYYNLHHQYAPSLEGAYGDNPDEALAYIGLLGTGPLYLPASCTETWGETGNTRASDSGSNTRRFSYGFNDDGSISYCNVNSSRYNYGYEYLTDTRSIVVLNNEMGRRHFRLLFPVKQKSCKHNK